MMQEFTGFEYLMLDVAGKFGHDKWLFGQRLQWVKDNMSTLEELTPDSDPKERALFQKAVMVLRSVMAGNDTGHMVGFDACCSGVQIMSAMTGCIVGATNTGMVNPDERADAYGMLLKVMQHILQDYHAGKITRAQAKDAMMTAFYGSKDRPKKIFGVDTPELAAFYEASAIIAPGAWGLLQELLSAWNPWAKKHSWKLPDGFDAVVKVMQKVEDCRVEVDELGGASFTYEFYVNEGSETGISLPANVTHSMDAYLLRSMHRRCNYDPAELFNALELCKTTLKLRASEAATRVEAEEGTKIAYYIAQYERSTIADVVIMPYIDPVSVQCMSVEHMIKLVEIMETMVAHRPFKIVTIHDEFKCHANNMNWLRKHYVNIMADIADSEVLSDILNQLYGTVGGKAKKLSNNLGDLIRKSNYALC